MRKSTPPKSLLLGLGVTVTVLTIVAIRWAVPAVSGNAPAMVPYTVVLAEALTAPDGTQRTAALRTIAVRFDGSTLQAFGAEGTNRVRHLDLATGARIKTNDALRLKSSTRGSPNAFLQPNPELKCVARPRDTVLGEDSVAGYRAVKLQSGQPTVWLALDYGCALLRQHVDSGDRGKSETELVVLTPGEPSPSLFHIPSDFREVAPSLLHGSAGDCGPDCQRQNAIDDKHYYAHRLQ